LVNPDGQLVMKGWTSLEFRSRRNQGRLVRSTQLGGAQYRFARTTTIPAGQAKTWKTPFKWGDYGRRPGIYHITWRFGKAVSNAVSFEVLEEGQEGDERSRVFSANISVEEDQSTIASRSESAAQGASGDGQSVQHACLAIGTGAVLLLAAGAWLLLRRRARSEVKG
jgi:hypothetical protein